MNYLLLQLTAFVGGVVYFSFFEWVLHRFFMHQVTWGIVYPFKAHAQVHHQVFKSDHTYLLRPGIDKTLITFAWWNFPLLVLINSPVFLVPEFLGLRVTPGLLLGLTSYYAAYEGLHYLMHDPKNSWIERTSFFRFINRHHLIHHKYMHRNLNVVLPIADFFLRTLVLHPTEDFTKGNPLLTPGGREVLAAASEPKVPVSA